MFSLNIKPAAATNCNAVKNDNLRLAITYDLYNLISDNNANFILTNMAPRHLKFSMLRIQKKREKWAEDINCFLGYSDNCDSKYLNKKELKTTMSEIIKTADIIRNTETIKECILY